MTTYPHIARHRMAMGFTTVLILVVVIVLLPIHLPRWTSMYSRLIPEREWVILRSGSGQVVSVLWNNASGVVEEYSVTEPQRGDAMQFLLAPELSVNRTVEKGDTVGWVLSPELARELTALEGALDVARAELSAASTGEKPALVTQARSALSQAEAAYDEQLHLNARQEELHRRGIISDEEWELSRDRLAVLEAGVDVARAQLAAVSSGQKAEEIQQRERAVNALEEEITALRHRLSSFTHIAPFSGELHNAFTVDTLLALQDPASMLLVLPVPVDDCARLQREAQISFDIPRTGYSGTAHMIRVSNDVHYLQGEPVCLCLARVDPGEKHLRTGMIVAASVPCTGMTPLEYINHFWTRLFR